MEFLTSKVSSSLIVIALIAFVIACSTQTHLPVDAHPSNATNLEPAADASPAASLPLRTVTDIPLTGGTTRLDYQSLDSSSGRLYIAHLGSDLMTVFDVNKQTIVGDVKDLRHVHGVLAVPELHRVYASATGTGELAVIDDQKLTIVARVPAGEPGRGDRRARSGCGDSRRPLVCVAPTREDPGRARRAADLGPR